MRSYKITDILGLKGVKARKFNHQISQLEDKKSHQNSVSAEIMAALFQESNQIIKELGFLDRNVLVEEATFALKNKILNTSSLDNNIFWEKFSSSVILANNGIVSANKMDVENFINNNTIKIESGYFEQKFRDRILEKYHDKFPEYSKKQLEEKIF